MLKYYVTIYDKNNKLLCWHETNNKHEAEQLSQDYNIKAYCYSKVERKRDLYETSLQY